MHNLANLTIKIYVDQHLSGTIYQFTIEVLDPLEEIFLFTVGKCLSKWGVIEIPNAWKPVCELNRPSLHYPGCQHDLKSRAEWISSFRIPPADQSRPRELYRVVSSFSDWFSLIPDFQGQFFPIFLDFFSRILRDSLRSYLLIYLLIYLLFTY